MSDKPTSAGLWERESVFYRVWKKPTDGRFTAAEITEHGEQLGTFWADTLPGNWRKITAGTPKVGGLGCPGIGGGREFLELRQRIAYLESVCRETLDGLNDVYDGCDDSRTKYLGEHITRLTEAVFPTSPQLTLPAAPEVIDWNRLREWAADPRKKVPELAFTSGPEREIADLIMMCRVSIEPPEVIEVIEGRGQRVGDLAGPYLEDPLDGPVDIVRFGANDIFGTGARYMRCPEFPPRPTFTLTADLAAKDAEIAELRDDIEHAVCEAKRREPEYPWDQNTASEAVWALGESLLGTESALKHWQDENERLRTACEAAKKLVRNARGAIESGQVTDKDVHGTLMRCERELTAAMARGTE
jgi:hypothetical protein